MKHTTEQKYQYLLSLLQVQDIDRYEQDALLTLPEVYFQFSANDDLHDKDTIVELCMSDWYRNSK